MTDHVPPREAYATLSRMAFGFTASQILYAAVRLGVPDALAAGALPIGRLADAVGADPGALRRLVRALVVLGVVAEEPPGHYALAEMGRPLLAGHPRSMRSGVLLLGDPATWRAWGALTHAARTGEAAFDHVHGRPLFDHLARDPELSGIFNTAMREGTGQIAPEVPKAYDFSGARTVVDIGGGNGALLAAILAAASDARGVLFDTAEGVAGAAETFRRAGVSDRCSIRTGDFFEAVPEGDLLLVKGVLHDWDDERCVTLLRGCRASIAAGGRLLVLEPVLPSRIGTPEGAAVVMSDIAMLVYTGGRERDRDEFRRLLAAGGFALAGVTPPLGGSAVRILVADPV
ncbi:methyltransferase [Sphaerisporangium album]|uniref:Methyltransferase n=1 Tax=Sphaerisporangium album TaxID=509200 RepID=A0A367FHP7_9ACTN|nr:methyltransferase [Sphaerisporangium album]RCG29886.1 methyltransferase [Sphaerisporangium album]